NDRYLSELLIDTRCLIVLLFLVRAGLSLLVSPSLHYQLASDVTFIGSYTVFSVLGSDQFFYSDENDSSAYDALDFQTAEDEPDDLVGLTKVGGELWLFGDSTIEIHQLTGGDLLFQRINGATKKIGCLTRDTISTMDNNVFWLGDDRFIYMNNGYQEVKISNFAIDQVL
ncbi:unnamed protein product, partial [marine sediment metagenome]